MSKKKELEYERFDVERLEKIENFITEQQKINAVIDTKLSEQMEYQQKQTSTMAEMNKNFLKLLERLDKQESILTTEIPVTEKVTPIIEKEVVYGKSDENLVEDRRASIGLSPEDLGKVLNEVSSTAAEKPKHFMDKSVSFDVRSYKQLSPSSQYYENSSINDAKRVRDEKLRFAQTPDVSEGLKSLDENLADITSLFRVNHGVDDLYYQRVTTESWPETLPATNMILHVYDYYVRFKQYQLKNGSRIPIASTIDRSFYAAAMTAYASKTGVELQSADVFLRLSDENALKILISYLLPKTKTMWVKNILMMFARYKVPPYPPNAFNAQAFYQTALGYSQEFNVIN